MNKTKKGFVIFLLAAALMISMVGMASAAPVYVQWDLDSETVTGGYVMEKSDGSDDGQDGSVEIAAGSDTMWISDDAAACDVGFPAATWYVHLWKSGDGDLYKVELGVWDGSSFTSYGTADDDFGESPVKTTEVSVSAFTVPTGEYVALRVTNREATDAFTVITDASSYVKSSPMLPTIIPVDIKPESCPNAFNPKRGGVMSVAVLGTEYFDVRTINPGTIFLKGVAPLRWSYEDVATPFEGELCDCHELGGDGYGDLQDGGEMVIETEKRGKWHRDGGLQPCI